MHKTIIIHGVEYNLTPVESDKTKYPNAAKWARDMDDLVIYYIDAWGNAEECDNLNNRDFHDVANSFATEEAAQNMADRQTLQREIERWRDENDPVILDWEDKTQSKWYYYYDMYQTANCMGGIRYNHNSNYIYPNTTYFSSIKLTKECVETFKNEILKIQFGVK